MKPSVSSVKVDIEKFDGNDFGIWQLKMRALLVQQGLLKTLKGVKALPNTWTDEEKEDVMERALGAILLTLSNEVLREVGSIKSAPELWQKLESFYMTKSLAKRLYLKKSLHTLRMDEGYWPSNVRVCGFWFLPNEWQFSCKQCSELSRIVSSERLYTNDEMCSAHVQLEYFLKTPVSMPPVFIGLSSVGSMGFLKNAPVFLRLLQTVLEITNYRFILFTAGYIPLVAAIRAVAAESSPYVTHKQFNDECISLFNDRLFCFSGTVPYKWLFTRCAAAIHHGGSGTTAAALLAGIPQVVCPFVLDQFYWAERMFWLGVAPEPLKRTHLLPEESDEKIAANFLSRAIHDALSPEIKERAVEISKRISLGDGVSNAVKYIKEEIIGGSS